MPVYEYQCEKCCHQFELKQSFKDDPIVTCPQCGSKAKRVFSSVPIIFKGSGFYTTDSRQTGGKPPKPETKPDSAKHKPSG
jgi:putative FmdB family regulatory protein